MTEELFRDDATLERCEAHVRRPSAKAAWCSTARCSTRWAAARPATAGACCWPTAARWTSTDTRKSKLQPGAIVHLPAEAELPLLGERHGADGAASTSSAGARTCASTPRRTCCARWCRTRWTAARSRADYARLDFHTAEPLDKDTLNAGLARLVAEAHPVRQRWISEAELDANPGLVRSMSVQPPRGLGRVRVLEIEGVDLQPCGGTHVANTRRDRRASS